MVRRCEGLMVIAYTTILGLLIGSFLTVVVDRVPAQRLLKTDEQGNVSRSTEEDVSKRRAELERSASSNCG